MKPSAIASRQSVSNGQDCTDCRCPLCSKPYINDNPGTHRLVSLRCGHLFGKSCVKSFVKTQHQCPTCGAAAGIAGIRNIHATHLQTLDTGEIAHRLEECRSKCEQSLNNIRNIEGINSSLRARLESMRLEKLVLTKEFAWIKREALGIGDHNYAAE